MTRNDRLRRRFVQAGTAAGFASAISLTGSTAADSSPDLEKFVQPVPIPTVREPDATNVGIDYYDIPIREFEQTVHPDLPATTFWGFDGQVPGPIIKAQRDEPVAVHFDNDDLPTEHLFEVDEEIHGTSPEDYDDHDGPVPEVRTVTHQHGLNVAPESDGQGDQWTSPDGTTGPGYERWAHRIPNWQRRMTSTYHDHALGLSRLNNYAGLQGFYVIESRAERELDLPDGAYDVPLMIQDKTFDDDGSLHYPDEFTSEFAGDTALVNGAAWPYMEVEPRRYRFRLVNGSNGRTFAFALDNDDGTDAPTMYQFAPDHGFLEEVVPIGPDGDLESLLLSPFERAEVVVDFSDYAGETLTLTNHAPFPYTGDVSDEPIDDVSEIMQFRVADSVSEPDDSVDPRTLELPDWSGYDESATTETRQMTMGMRLDEGSVVHVLNDKASFDDGDYAQPELGATEVWELQNDTGQAHPIHLHLVDFEVVGRGPDGTEDPDPNERGPKDTVRVDPDETVRIRTQFGNFTGGYVWHCHALEHEDNAMMRPFEVVESDVDVADLLEESETDLDLPAWTHRNRILNS